MPIVLGVDAGNTKTIALVARSDGAVLGHGRSGCGDIYGAVSEAAAVAKITEAIDAALGRAEVARSELAAAVISAAGADWPEDYAFLRDAIAALGISNPVIYNDAIGALRAGSPDGTGVVVACGTGAAVGGRSGDGRIWHTSFWQQVGGAGDLAAKTLAAVYREAMGLAQPTALTQAVLGFFGLPTVEDVLHALTARQSANTGESRFIHPRVAGLVPVLFDIAAAGDAVARGIVMAQGEALGDHALLAARRLEMLGQPFYLVLTGGVLRHPGGMLRSAIAGRVLETAPRARLTQTHFEPALGALLLALEGCGVTIDSGVLAQLARTTPPAGLFET